MRERINWRWAVGTTGLGVAVASGGLWVGGFHAAVVSSLLLNAGTAIGVIAVAVFVQPRLVRRVTQAVKGAAAEAVDSATADLRQRVVTLENLDSEQQEQRVARVAARDAELDRLQSDELGPANIGTLLAAAHDEGLFDGGEFRVRTGPLPDAHVLFMLPLRAPNGVRLMWLDFEPFTFSGEIDAELGFPLPSKGPTTLAWVDEPASEIASDLESGLERANRPRNEFSFAYGLRRLIDSVRIMRSARSADAGSGLRLDGSLRLVINARWLLTSHGLEAVFTGAAFPVTAGGWRGNGGHTWLPACVSNCERPIDEPEAEWNDALAWLMQREGMELLPPGQTQ